MNCTCAHVLPNADAPAAGAHVIRIDGDRIVAVEPAEAGARRLLALPALTNAHDHARVTSTTAYGGAGKPLETWIAYLALLPSVDPYLAAAVSLSRSALGGAGAVMVHYTRVQGLTDLPTEVAEVARAARDVGVRVGFAVAMRNRNPLVYGPSEPILAALSPQARDEVQKRYLRPPLPVEQQIALVDAVANGRGQSDVRRAIRAAGGAVVHARASRSDRGCFEAHRPPHPHASPGDQHAARVARRQLSRRHPEVPRQHRLPQPAADARPLHLGTARRT